MEGSQFQKLVWTGVVELHRICKPVAVIYSERVSDSKNTLLKTEQAFQHFLGTFPKYGALSMNKNHSLFC